MIFFVVNKTLHRILLKNHVKIRAWVFNTVQRLIWSMLCVCVRVCVFKKKWKSQAVIKNLANRSSERKVEWVVPSKSGWQVRVGKTMPKSSWVFKFKGRPEVRVMKNTVQMPRLMARTVPFDLTYSDFLGVCLPYHWTLTSLMLLLSQVIC